MNQDTNTPQMRIAGFYTRWRNTIFSTADHLWLLILWAASTPVFIHMLGSDVFGVWILINAVIGLGGVMSLGFGEATVRYVALYRGQNKMGDVLRIINTTLSLYAVIGLVSGVAVIVAAPLIESTAFKLAGPIKSDAILALQLAGVALIVTAYLKTYEAVINGFERFDLTARVGIVTRSFIILGNVALVLMGYGLPLLIGCAVIGLMGQTVAYFIMCRRLFTPELPIMSMPDLETAREIAGFGVQTWLQICAGALNTLADRFLVAMLIDPSAAGIYAICLQLAQQIHLLLIRGLAFMMPATSRDAAGIDSDRKKLDSYRAGTTLVLLMTGAIALPMYALAGQILQIWLGGEFSIAGAETLRLMTMYFPLWGAMVPMFYLLNGAGFPGWNTTATIGHSIAGLALAGALLPAMGLTGAASARIFALPIMFLTIWAGHRYVLNGNGWPTSLKLFGWLAVLGLTAWGAEQITSQWVPATFVGVFGAGLFLALSGAALGLVPYLVNRKQALSRR